jgi:hypothetical protein
MSFPGSNAKFCGDCGKTCEYINLNFDEIRPGCFPMTTLLLTLPFSPSSSGEIQMAVIHHTPYYPDLVTCDLFLFPKMKLELKGPHVNTTEEIRAESQRLLNILTGKNIQ